MSKPNDITDEIKRAEAIVSKRGLSNIKNHALEAMEESKNKRPKYPKPEQGPKVLLRGIWRFLKLFIMGFLVFPQFLLTVVVFLFPGVLVAFATNWLLVDVLTVDFGDFREMLLGLVAIVVSSIIFEETPGGKQIMSKLGWHSGA